ncbi:MAG: VWA domain-containing protein [Oligoflexia bacterium]|nr:VWA domain-containing protein [Oligoflexia bacterium]
MFAHPEYLYLLLFIPVFFIFFISRLKSNDRLLRSYIKESCLKVVVGFVYRKRQVFRFFILLMVFLFLILALARPQSRKEKQEIEIKGAEVMILADVSKSMLVEDMGGFSRLNVMKKELDKLVNKLAGQRVGLISFSGSAVLISPLTLDHSALKLFLKSLSHREHTVQGTDFGSAFRIAGQALKRGSALDPASSARVVVVASDGEDNEAQALRIAKELTSQKVRIFALGFGTRQGGMIPVYDKQGNKVSYKKDREGNPVISRFDESHLKKIAHTGQGAFYTVSLGGDTINRVYKDIQRVGKDMSSYELRNVHKEWYQYFVFIAILFGFIYFLMGEKKRGDLKEWHSYTGPV